MTNFLSLLVSGIIILNIFLAIALNFLERRDASSTWAWIMILILYSIIWFRLFTYLEESYVKNIFFVGKVKIRLVSTS